MPYSKYARPAAAAVAVLAIAGAAAGFVAANHGAANHGAAARPAAAAPGHRPATRLTSSSCSGPAGAVYIADAGWDGFTAINTANCAITQTYNVGDTQVKGDPGDYNYSSSADSVVMHGTELYFADAGNDSVAIIDAAKLNPKNYSPGEYLIHVGFDPQGLALSPDGSQLWVSDTGPQTGGTAPSTISIISAAARKVTKTVHLSGGPTAIAFSPDGAQAYISTSYGVAVFDTATARQVALIGGVGDPHGIAVSPDGKTLYVTNTTAGAVDMVDVATRKVTGQVKVGEMPWQEALTASGQKLYVADGDSNAISVIDTATGRVAQTFAVPGNPDTLGLTPDGRQLWVGGLSSADVTVLNAATGAVAGVVNLGGDGANSGDGYAPTGMVLTATPTPAG